MTGPRFSPHQLGFDFRTGNILVSIDPTTSQLDALWILDWELAKYGPAASDLGQFCAEAWNIAYFRDRDAGIGLLNSFHEAYIDALRVSINDTSAVNIRGAEVALHAAAHVAVWTPVAGWSENEETLRQFESNMFGHLLDAWDALKGTKKMDWWMAF